MTDSHLDPTREQPMERGHLHRRDRDVSQRHRQQPHSSCRCSGAGRAWLLLLFGWSNEDLVDGHVSRTRDDVGDCIGDVVRFKSLHVGETLG